MLFLLLFIMKFRKERERRFKGSAMYESSQSWAVGPIIFKLWSIVTCTARLCLPYDLVPAVLLDKAFQQISIKSYFWRFKTKNNSNNKSLIKKNKKKLLWTKTWHDIVNPGQLPHQLFIDHRFGILKMSTFCGFCRHCEMYMVLNFFSLFLGKRVHNVQEHREGPHNQNNNFQVG